jgi:hypothetical protein
MNELLIVALGSLFSTWQISKAEEAAIARWIVGLNRFLNNSPDSTLLKHRAWLKVLASASQRFMNLNDENAVHRSELIIWVEDGLRTFSVSEKSSLIASSASATP